MAKKFQLRQSGFVLPEENSEMKKPLEGVEYLDSILQSEKFMDSLTLVLETLKFSLKIVQVLQNKIIDCLMRPLSLTTII